MRRRVLVSVIAAALACSACRKSSAPETKASPQNTQSAASPKVRHRNFGNGPSPAIVSISPDTVPMRAGHAYVERYTLEYDILDIEKVKSARIVIYSPGVGQVQSFDVSVQVHGKIEFNLDAENFDFGPTVRFRALCPRGTTDWYTMGTLPADYAQRSADRMQIGNVNPSYVAASNDANSPGSAIEITLWGAQFEPGCKAETEVDGAPVELQNVYAVNKQIKGLLLRSDIQQRAITARYLEVDLQLMNTGMAVEDTVHLNFREL